jgi:hypothetical protein
MSEILLIGIIFIPIILYYSVYLFVIISGLLVFGTPMLILYCLLVILYCLPRMYQYIQLVVMLVGTTLFYGFMTIISTCCLPLLLIECLYLYLLGNNDRIKIRVKSYSDMVKKFCLYIVEDYKQIIKKEK